VEKRKVQVWENLENYEYWAERIKKTIENLAVASFENGKNPVRFKF